MSPAPPERERIARAAGLAPLFEVHLRFAARVAELTGLPLAEAVRRHTPIHRRLGLGPPDRDLASPEWTAFAATLEAAEGLDAQVAAVTAAWITAADEPQPRPGETGFGCFAHEPPRPDGTVKIHFYNRDTDAAGGPLARSKIDRRRAELAALARNVVRQHPEATRITGRSWLYNLEAYRRLFPAGYVASRRPATPPAHLSGTSVWGQVTDSRDAVRPDVRNALLAALPALDPAAPWRAFPLQPFEVESPADAFAAAYDTTGT